MRARAVTVADTPTLICDGGARVNPDQVVILVPTGGATVYLGDASVTTSTGFPVAAGGVFKWALTSESIYGVVASSTQAVSVAERGN